MKDTIHWHVFRSTLNNCMLRANPSTTLPLYGCHGHCMIEGAFLCNTQNQSKLIHLSESRVIYPNPRVGFQQGTGPVSWSGERMQAPHWMIDNLTFCGFLLSFALVDFGWIPTELKNRKLWLDKSCLLVCNSESTLQIFTQPFLHNHPLFKSPVLQNVPGAQVDQHWLGKGGRMFLFAVFPWIPQLCQHRELIGLSSN